MTLLHLSSDFTQNEAERSEDDWFGEFLNNTHSASSGIQMWRRTLMLPTRACVCVSGYLEDYEPLIRPHVVDNGREGSVKAPERALKWLELTLMELMHWWSRVNLKKRLASAPVSYISK